MNLSSNDHISSKRWKQFLSRNPSTPAQYFWPSNPRRQGNLCNTAKSLQNAGHYCSLLYSTTTPPTMLENSPITHSTHHNSYTSIASPIQRHCHNMLNKQRTSSPLTEEYRINHVTTQSYFAIQVKPCQQVNHLPLHHYIHHQETPTSSNLQTWNTLLF